ncbi:Hypothetical predicted protein [Mytilus galloprovincialis]|uniref:Uncharacterized protein n=1 Tax=Mytilus galloprovincialis TaxID=29158 RepID=A0A8B6FT91_MYTGA|nr:Hypothetical predicted protein [Mytilus galloprovincialis]
MNCTNPWDFKEANYDQNNVNNSESNDHSENYHIEQDQESPECSYCLCRPCITDERNRQMWWENENCVPHERNSFLRKDKFKRFWTNLFHRGVLNDPRYLRRKRDALKRDRPRRQYTYHRRDLIPKCVLELVRKWFPNPSCQEYMGHKWD